MITAIDTNVLIDVLEADPEFGEASAIAIANSSGLGALIVCEVVWAEVATAYATPDAVLADLDAFGVKFEAMTKQSALAAARAWSHYRASGGKRSRIAADFLIGGHAACQADRLLTRDQGFHVKHFAQLQVVAPSHIA